ncbi:hypothetical protein COUCH_01730 [Couchioplanes caeruleus]|uniref:hypothetical protein n=1 Tax=Couchioplanes caeruleus TaxID=56438 RepID=UPI0020C12F51|nr:hypothetical protein [Couchioplanes caeruleus]UQU65102.1 hypothetical protein COUCH_01730 [Couchioplanes caeruleus]
MARTMARLTRRQTDHTPWCARDHRCGVAEHRSADITAAGIGGRAWLTRVQAGDVAYIEVRARIPLHSNEKTARVQLATALNLMRDLLAEVAPRLGRVTGRTYPAIGRRTT